MKRILQTGMLLVLALAFIASAGAAGQIVVKEADIRRVLDDHLRQKSENLGLDVSVKKIGYSGDMALPAGTISYEVVAPDRWEGWGNANLALIVRVNDRVERNISVKVEVEALADVVVAVRPLERGEVIGNGDIAVQKRDLAKMQGKTCRLASEAVGKRVRTAIRGNNPIRADYLERISLVKSGQLVTIVVENDALRITAAGRARNSGAEGDTVMVQNLASQKEVAARVVDATTVKVDF